MQYVLDLIPHKVENSLIHQRASDGYVNATAMCQAAGKLFGHYRERDSTVAYLEELSLDIGIPISKLVLSIKGGDIKFQGTWVHPEVAIHLAQWCSPKFAVAVARWVHEWMTGKGGRATLPYHLERYLANCDQVPPGHFSMLAEMTLALIAPLERAGYRLPQDMLPDISEGLMFCKWLRESKGIDTAMLPTYPHRFADGRLVNPKCYPNELLADFRHHFAHVWLPRMAEAYFADRDAKALAYLPKLLPQRRPDLN